VRLGIRSLLLLALGSLLILAFVPLYFAVANLTRVSMAKERAVASSPRAGRRASSPGSSIPRPSGSRR
jgi:hypothetical protein